MARIEDQPYWTRLWNEDSDTGEKGFRFDLTKNTPESLAESGWVDHPWKAGYNPAGGNALEMHRIWNMVKEGTLSRIGSAIPQAVRDPDRVLANDNARLQDTLRLQEDEISKLRRELRESKERHADEVSDASKIIEKPVGQQPLSKKKKVEDTSGSTDLA